MITLASSAPTWGGRVFLLALLVMTPLDAHACAVCWGEAGDPLVSGANNGIRVLLGVVVFVQIAFAALFWSFWRRSRHQRQPGASLRFGAGAAPLAARCDQRGEVQP